MKKIYIIGHKNPDTDSICAAMCLQYFNKLMEGKGEARRLGELNDETKFVLNFVGLEEPILLNTSCEDDEFILVDHNEPNQSIDNIENRKVIQVIDHHRIANFNTKNPIFYRSEPIGSTCSIIYKMFKENKLEISKEIALLLLSAIISDTVLLISPTCTEEDKNIAYELAKIADVNLNKYGIEMLKAGTNIKDKDNNTILNLDNKEFIEGDIKFLVSQINIVSFDEINGIVDELILDMEKILFERKQKFFILMVTNIFTSHTKMLVVGNKELVSKAFNRKYEGKYIELPGVISRKKQIIPILSDYINKKNEI